MKKFDSVNSYFIILLTILIFSAVVGCADTLPDPGAPGADGSGSVTIPIAKVFEIIAAENDVARTLYTAKVVGPGLRIGIPFDEEWQDEDVQAGPLPALFLRGASSSIAKNPVPLGLFLGSDFPIEPANLFTDIQQEKFELIRVDGKPQSFFDGEQALHTAMFQDVASAMPCVTCHNEHPETPKADWNLDDIMGATTWTYPKDEVSVAELYDILAAVRLGVRDSYASFITESEDWDNRPEVGDLWPSESDFAIPSTDAFMARFEELASPSTLAAVMESTAP